jgi:hypothetical protein
VAPRHVLRPQVAQTLKRSSKELLTMSRSCERHRNRDVRVDPVRLLPDGTRLPVTIKAMIRAHIGLSASPKPYADPTRVELLIAVTPLREHDFHAIMEIFGRGRLNV